MKQELFESRNYFSYNVYSKMHCPSSRTQQKDNSIDIIIIIITVTGTSTSVATIVVLYNHYNSNLYATIYHTKSLISTEKTMQKRHSMMLLLGYTFMWLWGNNVQFLIGFEHANFILFYSIAFKGCTQKKQRTMQCEE